MQWWWTSNYWPKAGKLVVCFGLVFAFAFQAQERKDEATPTRSEAQAEEEPKNFFERFKEYEALADQQFGKYLVAPVAEVIFFDLAKPFVDRAAEKEAIEAEIAGIQEQYDPQIEEAETKEKRQELTFEKNEQIRAAKLKSFPAIPFIVVWLFCGAVFFTLRMNFINVRAFWHAIRLTKGDYDHPHVKGEVTHFQALSSALSATVGLGNIAGVAIAVGTGGPGAIFWIIVVGLLGMTSKFAECTLGQMYRKVDLDGRVSGGPMHYLADGLKEMKLGALGGVLAILFSVLCIFASFGGGCAFQVSQSMQALIQIDIPFLGDFPIIYGILMSVAVALVIIGGIRSIAATAARIVPLMCGMYVICCLWIIGANLEAVPAAFSKIFNEAFTPAAAFGSFLGILVIGIKRAVFSNEAGVGSAAIAHSAAKTEEPVSEGIVALLEPFIDTVVVCTMTGLVLVITGVYLPDPSAMSLETNLTIQEYVGGDQGAALTALAFGRSVSWFPYVLAIAVVLFAYSTMISWSYYGERCWCALFGQSSSMAYKALFIFFVLLGSVVTASNIKDFSDLMILGMAFPNILGVALLSGKVRSALDNYLQRLNSGEIKPYKAPSAAEEQS